jgi:long-subunit acyl-CoA synthetase (AMP-forming)
VRIAGDGEILVEGNAFLGYLGAPGNPDRVIATGDLGRFDEEGYLVIEGRKKNVVITAFGRNVSPEWPEAELTAQPAILQAAVFGEARADCSAVLVAADPRLPDAALQAAVDAVNRGLPDYARIGAWVRSSEPFGAANGLATANGRPRRDAIWECFAALLEEGCGAQEEFR